MATLRSSLHYLPPTGPLTAGGPVAVRWRRVVRQLSALGRHNPPDVAAMLEVLQSVLGAGGVALWVYRREQWTCLAALGSAPANIPPVERTSTTYLAPLTEDEHLILVWDAGEPPLTWLALAMDVLALGVLHLRQAGLAQRHLSETETLSRIAQALNESPRLDHVLQAIVEAAQSLLPQAERAVIHLLQEESTVLKSVAVSGQITDYLPSDIVFKPGAGIAGRVIASGQPINVDDILNDPRYLRSARHKPTFRSLLVAPVQSRKQRLGTLSVQSPIPGAFTQDDERLLNTLGIYAALALENARLLADLERALEYEKAVRAQLVQAEKLMAVGRLVASVTHELNNPLQAIQNALFLVTHDPHLSQQARDDLRVAATEADRMADLISRLRETYRPAGAENFRLVSLNTIIEDVQKLVAHHLRRNHVDMHFVPDPTLPNIPSVRDQMKQVVLNLTLNAVEAMPQGGQLTVRTAHHPNRAQVSMEFADTGPGIEPANLPHIFEPFFTTKAGGTGLGLSISFEIVQRHHGHIEVHSQPGQGCVFVVWLPVVNPEMMPELPPMD